MKPYLLNIIQYNKYSDKNRLLGCCHADEAQGRFGEKAAICSPGGKATGVTSLVDPWAPELGDNLILLCFPVCGTLSGRPGLI